METELVNIYIKRLLKEVEDLTKLKLYNESRYEFLEILNNNLTERIKLLEQQVTKLTEKQEKKINKSKEVNTSSDTF